MIARLATFLLLVLLALPTHLHAQSREVHPGELELTVTLANGAATRYTQEMVLITIHGVYRRHITRETLEQPDLDGFNWTQLGPDTWYETLENGKRVKNFKRVMALYPDQPGALTIGPFTHRLTLIDEGDDWFDHAIESAPITVDVEPAPLLPEGEWWFPVRRLQVSDDWSNAPDQLKPGEGVLRVIRIEAVGATPEMIPPMPELVSPSAMIFPHPEKRFVELSPEGPVTYAFWRWTVRPTDTASTILEPIRVAYFDTRARAQRTVTIGAQRVAYDDSVAEIAAIAPPGTPVRLAALPMAAASLLGFGAGLALLLSGRRYAGFAAALRNGPLDPLARHARRAARRGDAAGLRRAAVALLRRDGPDPGRQAALAALDQALFAPGGGGIDLRALAARVVRRSP